MRVPSLMTARLPQLTARCLEVPRTPPLPRQSVQHPGCIPDLVTGFVTLSTGD